MASFIENAQYTFDDVVLVPQYSEIDSRKKDCDTTTILSDATCGVSFTFKTPICSSNMDTITGYEMAKRMSELGGLGIIHRGHPTAEYAIACMNRWIVEDVKGPLAISVGSISIEREKQRLADIMRAAKTLGYTKENLILCVDLAHCHSKNGIATVKAVREVFDGLIIAGAIATKQGAKDLKDAGAAVVRAGVGSGSGCKTRTTTGCGVPQLTTVIDTAGTCVVISDGGIRGGADAAKALAAGADMIMIGGLLAGTDYTPGWVEGGISEFKGMASNRAKNAVGLPSGFEEGVAITLKSKHKGSTDDVIASLVDGITSAMSYQNARNLIEFKEKAVFAHVSMASHYEGTPHIIDKLRADKSLWS